MSGHSHARTVKHQKDLDAQKRSKAFSKVSRLILVAVREGGANPETNASLRMAIDKAHYYNMPNDNIERAIKRATGELPSGKLEEFTFDAYGPEGIALIIEGITDNRKRALADIKKILSQYNGKLVAEGAVRWMFERKGCISVNIEEQKESLRNKEHLELIAIEAGAEDTVWRENYLDIYTNPEKMEDIKNALEKKEIKIDSSSLEWKPNKEVELEEKKKASSLKLFEALDDNEDVQDVYFDLKL